MILQNIYIHQYVRSSGNKIKLISSNVNAESHLFDLSNCQIKLN